MYYKLTDDIYDQGKSLYSCHNQSSDTLVIHPDDRTTDFLSAIYENKGWNVITSPFLENDVVAELIKKHDRIIALGHGSPDGLFGGYGMVINASLAPLLREKELVCIWCHADQFIQEQGLKGFYSGMFISEKQESEIYNIPADDLTIELSNDLFASTLGKYIDTPDLLENVKREYRADHDPIITFNRNRLYSNSTGGKIMTSQQASFP